MTLTPEQLQQWRALAERATPGPWVVDEAPRLSGAINALIDGLPRQIASADGQAAMFDHRAQTDVVLRDNARFIAAARSAVPQLLDEVERLAVSARHANYERDVARTLQGDDASGIARRMAPRLWTARMSDFIERANVRLMAAANLATKLENYDKPLAKELLALVVIARAAIDAVAGEGALPSNICNAVVHYGKPAGKP